MTISEPNSAQPVAYLTGEYPKVSHTFIQREIAALRGQGITVLPCTVRRAPSKDVVGQDQLDEQDGTFALIETAKKSPLKLLKAHFELIKQSPRRWLNTMGLACRTAPAGLKAGLWQLFYFLEAGLLARYMQDNNVRHLHNHFANSSCSVAMLASALSEIPYSVTMHGPAIFFEPMHWRIDEKIARAKFVSCISHFCRSQAMFFSDQAHWHKLRIVHCGIQPARYGTKPRGDFGKRVMFVGRLDAVKGVPLLLEAFGRLREKHPDATLNIIGDGPDRAALETQAKDMGDAVTFLGYQPQDAVAAHLEDADMLVLASFAEGVPVVLMEAMGSRIPVIASQVAGVGELIESGTSGYTIPAGDVDTLTMRLDTLLSDPDLCAQMGAAGRAKVEAEFDLEKEAAWLKRLILDDDPGTLRPTPKELS